MKSGKSKPQSYEPMIKSWYLEDESGIEHPKKEDVQKTCQRLGLPFTKDIAVAVIYGDNKTLPERIPPTWLNELP